jgi:hypothetical protein
MKQNQYVHFHQQVFVTGTVLVKLWAILLIVQNGKARVFIVKNIVINVKEQMYQEIMYHVLTKNVQSLMLTVGMDAKILTRVVLYILV